jgi:succinate dehydrogenase/fumarate reductase cytochrome b subunit (b558 family)
VLDPDPIQRPTAPPFVRRVLSVTGIVPLGVFLLGHLALNARALRGDAAFTRGILVLHRVPALALFEWLLLLAPLLLHAGIGTWLVLTKRPLAPTSPYPPALRTAVRATGIAAFAFLAMHLPELRFRMPAARLTGHELSTVLVADLSSTWHGVPWRGVAYLVGTACVTFHFASGLWALVVTTREGMSAVARKGTAWAAAAIGAAIWVLFANIVVFHATGARLFGGAEARDDGAGSPCPADP